MMFFFFRAEHYTSSQIHSQYLPVQMQMQKMHPLSSIERTRQSWKTQAQIANAVCSADNKY